MPVADIFFVGRVGIVLAVRVVVHDPRGVGINPLCDNGQARGDPIIAQGHVAEDIFQYSQQTFAVEFWFERSPCWA